jgi:hypothetical protein
MGGAGRDDLPGGAVLHGTNHARSFVYGVFGVAQRRDIVPRPSGCFYQGFAGEGFNIDIVDDDMHGLCFDKGQLLCANVRFFLFLPIKIIFFFNFSSLAWYL